jgi:hypothetical protein
VVLFERHLDRLGIRGTSVEAQFRGFASEGVPGTYALRIRDGRLEVERRAGSQLRDGMPVRYLKSPLAQPQRKRPAPSAYDAVRAEGIATLLTSENGRELYESCRGAVLIWDGARLVAVPEERPRTLSVTEQELDAQGLLARRPILADGTEPLLLINAVKGVCVPKVPGRAHVPSEVVVAVTEALHRGTTK